MLLHYSGDNGSITPTASLHFWYGRMTFISNETLCLPLQRCVAETVAVRSVWCILRIYPTYESNCIRRRLDRNSSRRWMLNCCGTHIQMMLPYYFSHGHCRCDRSVRCRSERTRRLVSVCSDIHPLLVFQLVVSVKTSSSSRCNHQDHLVSSYYEDSINTLKKMSCWDRVYPQCGH